MHLLHGVVSHTATNPQSHPEPDKGEFQPATAVKLSRPLFGSSCWLAETEIPPTWLAKFPSGAEVVAKAVQMQPANHLQPDKRLLKRRDCEFEIFRSVEEAIETPFIRNGFATLDDFINRAQSILQRRKSRAGRSLELHTRAIFIEEKLKEGVDFSHSPESEPDKRPDFLFPSEAAYKNSSFPTSHLRMLAVKTTCRDRWRQVLNEANRIEVKHLLTLQQGVSLKQFKEMKDAKIQLVVPKPLIRSFHKDIRPHIQTLESFIASIRKISAQR